MIKRYQTEPITLLFDERHKFETWLAVERVVAEAEEELGIIPHGLSRALRSIRIDPRRVSQIEEVTNHDVIAFLEAVREKIGSRGRWLHFGMTSYDLVDTALSIMVREACQVIGHGQIALSRVLKKLARRYRSTPQIGRTHGVFAQPITFGRKVESWLREIERSQTRLHEAVDEISYGKLSGAVGAFTILDPAVEHRVMRRLHLKPEPVSTQVIPRDRLAHLVSILVLYACALDRIATEIRNLSRSEIGEVNEPFGRGQKGSSAMPHKQNPIICERICGLAKVLRGYLVPAFENINLWHERDISNSSAERIILGDTFHLVHYCTLKLTHVLDSLQVHPDRMGMNLARTHGVYASQFLMNRLIEKGMSRKEAYDLTQELSFRAVQKEIDLAALARQDKRIRSRLNESDIVQIFDLQWFLRNLRRPRR